ncbi:DUF1659 domain-containing protein [Mesobacillus harenae]|uniref:DUF1659 domain-containing protein n=1 Tax=Mesobacillus harenae TaxID=2213203 RepID=UPI001581252C|nr:DUF1659 domain-containing protein [Mesobacillus harenae]
MAQAMIKSTNLRMFFEIGLDEKGQPIYKAKTYSNVKREATADQFHQAATALAGLSSYQLGSIERNDSFDII